MRDCTHTGITEGEADMDGTAVRNSRIEWPAHPSRTHPEPLETAKHNRCDRNRRAWPPGARSCRVAAWL